MKHIDTQKIKEQLKNEVNNQLYNHIISVAKKAKELARFYCVDIQSCEIAALMHDFAKQQNLTYNDIKNEDKYDQLEREPAVWHGYVASYIAKDLFNINDKNIIEAIKYHTTAKPNMNDIAKVVYIADSIEDLRDFPNIEYLRLYEKDLNTHFYKVLKNSYNYLKQKDIEIDQNTKKALDFYKE